ncbi:RodZ family helix-turn-helix domain-containing protein [Prochlorococcus sp. MIT 1306]|uniref:helix-turn-helix domain-containing protein n=1 Tax=Prochlorococcus sp. MIT 1306 TaxID=1799667 RepID=UPI0007B3785C|nr:helix-turn-helix domain-containing protein [Prochlorococcus sp. MIT 1306]KZR63088.1 Helix-turn-helix domain protein [Prochlorococcus sp. MIT 1306]
MPEHPQDFLSDQSHSEQLSTPLIQVGALLREAREKRGFSIAEIAGSLRIGKEQLIALENGNKDLLPEPVFIRAMVRRVAERLNLDATALVQQIQVIIPSSSEALRQSKSKASRPNLKVIPALAFLGGLIGLTAAGLAITYYSNPNTFSHIQRSINNAIISINNTAEGMIFGSSTRSNDVKEDEPKDTEPTSLPAYATPTQNLPSTSPSGLKKPNNNNQPASTEQQKTQPGPNPNPQQ